MAVAGQKERRRGERASLYANENDSVERRRQCKKSGEILEQWSR